MTLFLLVTMVGQSKGKGEFTVLQWNVWQEGTMVPGGYDAIVNEIVRSGKYAITITLVSTTVLWLLSKRKGWIITLSILMTQAC